MRLFQRILALRLDWAECRNGCGLMQAGADGVGIVALLGEKIGGRSSARAITSSNAEQSAASPGEAFLNQGLSHVPPTF
jgi:hypothetical protein